MLDNSCRSSVCLADSSGSSCLFAKQMHVESSFLKKNLWLRVQKNVSHFKESVSLCIEEITTLVLYS